MAKAAIFLCRLVHVCLLALGIALPLEARAEAPSVRVSMSASSTRVAVGEPFAVEIRVETRGEEVDEIELPDFGELEVLGRSTSRPFSFSFGFGTGGQRALVKSEIVHSFTLRASAAGAQVIRPAIVRAGGRRIASQSLSILVIDPGQSAPGADALAAPQRTAPDAVGPPPGALDGAEFDQTMFLRTVIDKKRAYVGEQVTVTLYLYLRGQIGESPSLTREPTLEGFWSHDLLPMQRSLSAVRQEVNGRMYSVYVLRRFAAFPLRPGTLEIGAPAVEVGGGGSIFDLLTGPSQPLRRNGVKVSVEALALPAQPTAGAPAFTGALTLQAALEPAQAKVGDAVTLRVSAKGRGNLRSLNLPTPALAQLEVLAPELDDQVTMELDQLGGERTFRWLILPRAPGKFQVPAFTIDVFDPTSGRYTRVQSPPHTLTVSGQPDAAPALKEPPAEEVSGVRFGPLRPESALRRREPELRERAFFWPSVLAAPLLLVALSGLRFVRMRLSRRRALSRDAVALREAAAKVDRAEQAAARSDAQAALGLLTSALKSTLEARLGEPVGGLTLRALEQYLRERGLDEKLIGRTAGQLGALERARFDPGAQGAVELSKAVAGVRALARELGRARVTPLPKTQERTSEPSESARGRGLS